GALAYTSGVIGQPYGYDSDTNWIMVRGFAATANGVFQDGLPNFSFGFGGFYVDPHMVERIEVLKGPSSVLYGSSNPGGIVNYVTKQPTGQNSTEVELGFDEHGRVWTSVDQNRVIDRSTAYRFLGKLERQDGHGAFEPGFHGLLHPPRDGSRGRTELWSGLPAYRRGPCRQCLAALCRYRGRCAIRPDRPRLQHG
ncbi:TonB-dependent receptor plug domain-containing protein, partial [Paracoccus sp. (in: a-proteobacteria)]|uniref:TonB-dependent receptor plug domain-containing protein n=1 Tax=Paracoccus sp. TaxID=267 RepID=UPI0028ACCFA3